MRRNGLSGLLAIIFLMVFFGFDPGLIIIGDLIRYLVPIIGVVAVIALLSFVFMKIKEKIGNKQKETKENAIKVDSDKIDNKLRKYFEKKVTLPIVDNVSLTCVKGKYTSIDNLMVMYGNEKILKLSEFLKYYPDDYNKILHMLELFSKKKDEEINEIKETVKYSKADRFIDQINELNDAIPHEEISNGLDQTCQLLKKIDLSKNNISEDKLAKLYEFYLPTLVNILNKYRQLNDSPVKNEEFNDCENNLIKTIILINQALKVIYESIHEFDYMDLNADISTLETVLKKDGLLDDKPFNGAKNE